MRWLGVVISSLVAISLTGLSVKTLFLYFACLGVSIWFVRLFLINHCELDFEVVFKVFEWFGYGTPHRIDRISGALYSTDGGNTLAEIPRPITRSLDRIISHILRDFVASWYNEVAKGESFTGEAQRLLQMLSVDMYKRACDVDIQNLIEQIIFTFHVHLQRYNKSVTVVKEKDPNLKLTISSAQLLCKTYESQVRKRHIALTNSAFELNYLRIVVDSLLALLIDHDDYRCNIGRFMLREILAMQTLKPLADLMTDPDWINEAVVAVLIEEPSSTVCCDGNMDSDTKPAGVSVDELSTKVQGSSDKLGPVQIDFEVLSDNCNTSESTILIDKRDLENHNTERNTEFVEDRNIDVKSIAETGAHSQELKHRRMDTGLAAEPEQNSEEKLALEQNSSNVSSSLSSSWSVVPPSKDETFYSKSYENLRDKLLLDEKGTSATLKEFTKLGSCCHKFETSCEIDQQDDKNGGFITQSRSPDNTIKSSSLSRSQSVPSCAEKVNAEAECSAVAANRTHKPLSRSVSVPTQLSSYKITETSVPVANHGNIFEYGSPFYSISFRSESDSYKTASSEDEFDEVEEVDESDDFVDESEVNGLDVFVADEAPAAPLHNGAGKFHKQLSFEEYVQLAKQSTEDSPVVNDHKEQYKTQGKHLVTGSCDATQLQGSTSHCNGFDTTGGCFYQGEYEEKFKRAHLLQSSKISQSSSSTATSSRDSDSFLGETLTSAKENWKKLVSSIKPFKFDLPGNASSSSKSNDTNSQTSQQSCDVSFDPSTREPSSTPRRCLSRSDAVVDSDSDTESSYGTPREDFNVREEIVYGGQEFVGNNHFDGPDKGIVKIHPSQLVRIPATELLSETGDEGPGRNKFTAYHIEYDIRIWPEVHQLAVYEARSNPDPEENSEVVEPSDEVVCQPNEELKKVDCKRVIKRRYREFMELHNRLVHGLHAKDMKAILKPNRKFNMPFGRLEPSVVEGRRTILQYYLVSLVSKPLLRESQELKEFLGVTGAGHVSFVKPSMAQMVSQSVYVPRVDKMLNRQVTKLIDKVKTAFDAVEEEEEPSRPVDKTIITTVDETVPWTLCYSEQSLEYDTKEPPSAETCFAVFIDCQDFELEIRPPSPVMQAQLNKATSCLDPQDRGPDVLTRHSLARPENYNPNEPSQGHSSDGTPDEEPAVEDSPRVWSSCMLHVNEELGTSTLDVDDEVKSHFPVRKRPLGASISLPPSRSPSMDKLNFPKLPKGRISPTALKDKLTSIASKGDVTPQALKGKLASIATKGDVTPQALKGKLASIATKGDVTPQALKGKLASIATKGDVTPQALKGKLASIATKGDVTPQALKGKLASIAAKGDVTPQALKGKLVSIASKGDVNPQALKGKLASIASKGDVTPQALKGKLASIAAKGDVTPQALKGKLVSIASKGDVNPQALKGKLASIASKGDVTPQALKGKLASIATKGDDAWDNIKENLKIKQRQGDAWEAIRDNVKLIKHPGSQRELVSKPEEVDEITEKFKPKQVNAWDNIKGNLNPKLKQGEAWHSFKDNLKLKQKIVDLPKKKHNEELSTDESREQSTVLISSHANQSEGSPSGHVIQGDVPLSRSPADRPSQQPTGLTGGVLNDEPQCPLANSIITLLCEILRGHNSWVCLDYVQHTFLGVFGGFFEWWLQGELDELVTEERWGYYLNLFDKAIWPNDELKTKQPEKSEEEKIRTKKEAIKTLMDFFPGVFRVAVGHSTYEESAVNIVESLQHPEINRILLYELLELLLVEISPELQVKNSEIWKN